MVGIGLRIGRLGVPGWGAEVGIMGGGSSGLTGLGEFGERGPGSKAGMTGGRRNWYKGCLERDGCLWIGLVFVD